MSPGGILLEGNHVDVANLMLLVQAWPQAHEAQWTRWDADGADGSVLVPDAALPVDELRRRGVPVCSVRPIADVEGRIEVFLLGEDLSRWESETSTTPKSLLLSLRPSRLVQDPGPGPVLFVADVASGAAQTLLNRLLRLGVDDAQVSEWNNAGAPELFVEVALAPRYLVMRAAEDPGAGVRAFVAESSRSTGAESSGVWIEWGFAFPLAASVENLLQNENSCALIDRHGVWRTLPRQWNRTSLFNVVVPTLPARKSTLSPVEDTTRFEVRLRLEACPPLDPELWLVTPSAFFELESFLYSASPEEIGRMTVARLADDQAHAVYVVRERAQSGKTTAGVSLSELFGTPGLVRAEGTDNLYLPVGRRLRPRMHRDELRTLLGLDDATLVLLDEDVDGPRITRVRDYVERPLTDWVDLVATDRRHELDRMLEDSVLSFPAIDIERPAPPAKKRKAPPKRRAPRVRIDKPQPRLDTVELEEGAADDDSALDRDAAALRATARPLEQKIVAGGHADAQTWISLGHLREALEEEDQAATCFETALFYLGEDALKVAVKDDVEDTAAGGLIAAMLRTRRKGYRAQGADEEELIELLTRDRKIAHEAAFLGALVLEMLATKNAVAMSVLPQIIATFRDRELPVSRRLVWSVLLAANVAASDTLGLTRAKEAVLGGLNDRGLNEAYDLPRFVRLELALEEGGEQGALARSRVEQLGALETLWDAACGEELEAFDADTAFLRAQFGVAFARLGAVGNARALVRPLEDELPAHDPPNRALLSLYLGRMAHAATHGADDAWREEVAAVLSGIENVRVRRTVEWLRKRSRWLNVDNTSAPPPWIRPEIERALRATEDAGEGFDSTLIATFRATELYDYELASAVERMIAGAIATGVDDTLAVVLDAAQSRLEKIEILGHRAAATGACIRAAATLGDLSRVDAFLDTVMEIARAPQVPSMRALLGAVEPALAALRRLGASDAGARFLSALERIEVRSKSERVRLMAAIADGLMNFQVENRPIEIIDQCLDLVLDDDLDHVGRFEGAVAVVTSLHHWPLAARRERCQRLLEALPSFRDTFTTSAYFGTHRVLMVEHILDAMCDVHTLQTDRVQAFLDAEEQLLRQVIVVDWSTQCGR